MLSVRTLQFNETHNRNYSDEELSAREAEAEPYVLYQYVGGARADYARLGDAFSVWTAVYRKGRTATASDDPNVIDDWVERERRRILGIDELDNKAPDEQGRLPTLLGGAHV